MCYYMCVAHRYLQCINVRVLVQICMQCIAKLIIFCVNILYSIFVLQKSDDVNENAKQFKNV